MGHFSLIVSPSSTWDKVPGHHEWYAGANLHGGESWLHMALPRPGHTGDWRLIMASIYLYHGNWHMQRKTTRAGWYTFTSPPTTLSTFVFVLTGFPEPVLWVATVDPGMGHLPELGWCTALACPSASPNPHCSRGWLFHSRPWWRLHSPFPLGLGE